MELKIMKKTVLIVTKRETGTETGTEREIVIKKNRSLSLSQISLSGFTLLEVMFSLIILSIGLLGLAALTATVIRTNSFSDDFTTATALAQDTLETLVSTSYENLTPDGTTDDPNNPIDENGSGGNSGSKYNRSWTIATVGSTRTIVVQVGWTDSQGYSKSVDFSTIRSDT